jgi:glutathione S-transferase
MWARIFSVIDTLDAMTSERPYAARRRLGEALEEIEACAGSQFDPVVVGALLDMEPAVIVTTLGLSAPQVMHARASAGFRWWVPDRRSLRTVRAVPNPTLTLHVLPPSHPCRTVTAALERKGLAFELVTLTPGPTPRRWRRSTARGTRPCRGCSWTTSGSTGRRRSSPGSRSSRRSRRSTLSRTRTASARPSCGATASSRTSAAGCRGARCTSGPRRWARSPAASRSIRPAPTSPCATSARRGSTTAITAEQLAATSRACPPSSTTSTRSCADGRARRRRAQRRRPADRATLRVLLTVGDVRPLLDGRPCAEIARRWFADYDGDVPAGAFPSGWVPAA